MPANIPIRSSTAESPAESLTAEISSPRRAANPFWSFLGPAFIASIAYIDPGNFATNILAGSKFGYRLLWVLLWSNAMAILIQYLSAKLGIVTGLTLPENCRRHFSRSTSMLLWVAAEIGAIATDLAEFLGAALGLDLLCGPLFHAYGLSPRAALIVAAFVAAALVFAILALELAGFRWLERGIMSFVGVIGLCYAFEVFLVHPNWRMAALSTLLPTLDRSSSATFHESIYAAVGMLGATVMPHVVYLHSALVHPRLRELTGAVVSPRSVGTERAEAYPLERPGRSIVARFLRFEFVDILIAMNGAWLINSGMVIVAACAFLHAPGVSPSVEEAYQTLGPLFGRAAAVVFAVALLCSGLSSSTVGVMAGQVIIDGFLNVQFPIFMRRLITIVPALIVIASGMDPLRILVLSQVVLSFALPFALMPLLVLTNRPDVMNSFVSARWMRIAGWLCVSVILTLNAILLAQMALGA
ncbi:MAG TPA: Nramp family divalent metal transporter [Acidobacteriaceae bacterium]|nr:Nramp family divalent metal transporter [Acidobacteriaceae bacterium]